MGAGAGGQAPQVCSDAEAALLCLLEARERAGFAEPVPVRLPLLRHYVHGAELPIMMRLAPQHWTSAAAFLMEGATNSVYSVVSSGTWLRSSEDIALEECALLTSVM